MKLSPEALSVLENSQLDGAHLRLPHQLPPQLYAQIKKILIAAGGPWSRKHQAHVFASDTAAAQALESLLSTHRVTTEREERQHLGYFPTPQGLVDELLDLADLHVGMEVLEPSAGQGAIAEAVADRICLVDCVELSPANAAVIEATGYARQLTVGDFLSVPPTPRYDRIVMSPPFAHQQDIAHVEHARRFLRPDGLLVAVMSASTTYHSNHRAQQFRQTVEQAGAELTPLPAKAFAPSGTDVATVMTVLPALDSHLIAA